MFLTHKPTDVLVEVMDLIDLFNPCCSEITGREHAGEELQDPTTFLKAELMFPSGEALPRCWLDRYYRNTQQPSRLSDRQLTPP
ncbi:MAG: acetyltransferase [Cyanobacteria bacterium CRU_2_1]|nr:acetyltransferase [Cyanobacteria bacterium RU_5_0]NJR60023.1 acetyltransferase [Cyanobacteria bacterium CRU_2_1]